MHRRTELLLISFFLIQRSYCSNDVLKPKIAIVGAGIGGASASHFLTELLDENLEIDIFESNEIGGRLATVKVGGKFYEAGGSVIDSQNKYMKDFVKLLGLEEKPISKEIKSGIWNGNEFLLKESKWDLVSMTDQLARRINPILASFGNIYQSQDDGEAYDNVIDLISAMSPELAKLLQVSTAEYFHSLGFSKSIIEQVVKATVVKDFGQSTEVHSFLGSICVSIATADLWDVKGGNKEVPKHLISRNSKVNVVRAQVEAIRYLVDDESQTQYEISYSNTGSDNVIKNIYDIIIIATPLTNDQKYSIDFVGFPNNDISRIPGYYQKAVATLVKGNLNLSHFSLEESLDLIISCDQSKTEIDSVLKVYPVDEATKNDSRVWKVVSGKPVTSDKINSIFSQVDEVQEVHWIAYPKYSSNARSDKFELHDSLYHVNAIDWAASTMETSAVAGRNVALLIYKKLASYKDQNVSESRRNVEL